MGSSDGNKEENFFDWGIWTRRWVCSAPSVSDFGLDISSGYYAILTPSNWQNRICVITILRIKYLSSVDLQNITYSVAPAWLFTLLEPMLGILNACLPVIRPAITKLSRNTKMPSSKHSRSKASTSAKNSSHGQSSGFTPKRFQRLDEHAYPLTETSGNFNLNDIGGLENDASSGDQDVEQQTYASNPRDQKDAIVIKSG